MALIWQKQLHGNRYEVRSHGRTRRLYTNGVCHSDYHPQRVLTRSIWDCLFLPLLLPPTEQLARVLVLGVGGGSVIHLIQRHLPQAEVTGVELSAVHLDVARRYFGLHAADLQQADAADWLQAYDGPPFDAIIDDLFLETGHAARRAIAADADWFRLLLSRLARGGVITMNLADDQELKHCGWYTHATVRRQLPGAFALRTPLLHNVVGAYLRAPDDSIRLRKRIENLPALARAQKRGELRYSMRRLREPQH